MPDHLKVAAVVGYATGMRLGEILALRWDHVDWEHGTLMTDPGTTKNDEGRCVPLTDEVSEVLSRWKKITLTKYPSCQWVVHFRGERVRDIRAGWKEACKRIGLEGTLFHDLRRSAVRNMVRAGVPQAVAKKISGYKTDSMFSRYNIVSEGDRQRPPRS